METSKLSLLNHAMEAYTLRTKALTSNLANIDTPGYKRLSVTFEETLQETRTSVPGLRHEDDVRARMQVDDGPPVLETEMMDLADTQMRTQLTTRALSEHFGLMRTGITGRTA